jgi:hypothetical protein
LVEEKPQCASMAARFRKIFVRISLFVCFECDPLSEEVEEEKKKDFSASFEGNIFYFIL